MGGVEGLCLFFIYIYVCIVPRGVNLFGGVRGWVGSVPYLSIELRLDFYPFSMSPRHSLVFRISSPVS